MKLGELLEVISSEIRVDLYKEDDPEGTIKLMGSRTDGDNSVFDSYKDWEVSSVVPITDWQNDNAYISIILKVFNK